MTDPKAHFSEIAPPFMQLLLEDFPTLDKLDAAAVFGNFGHESNGFTSLQETRPTVPGSRGGYGWAQWTGPRRRAYEAYCLRNGKDPAAPASNYAYVFVELTGPEAAAIGALMDARTLYQKVEAFELAFERAGVKHYASRKQWALIALQAYEQWLAERGEVDRQPDTGETLPAPSLPEMATIEAVTRLAAMTPEQLHSAAMTISMAMAVQRGWKIEDPAGGISGLNVRTPGITFTQPTETENMNGVKSWFQSKGVVAGLASVAALIGPIFGLDLGQTNINDAIVSINQLVAAGAALVSIWGRITAKSQIAGGLTGKG
jgi:hypothetical protein